MRIAIALLASLAIHASAAAADLSVAIKDPSGKPVQDAVVTVVPAAGLPTGPIRFSWPYEVDQKGAAFQPFVLVVPVGSDVVFHNRDPFRHHVYSFSAPKQFELKLFGSDEQRTVHFDKPGTDALGCNIHDRMMGFVRIVETPFAAKTDASGTALVKDLPAGAATLTVWHPFLAAPNNEMSLDVPAAAGVGPFAVTADVRPPPPAENDGMDVTN